MRWLRRAIEVQIDRGGDKPDELIVKIRNDFESIITDDPISDINLKITAQDAEILLTDVSSRDQDVRTTYQQCEDRLEQLLADAQTSSLIQGRAREVQFLLAMMHYGWAYYERKDQNFATAAKHNKKAASIYKELGKETDILRATVLNNLGFVLAQQGELKRGLHFCEYALRLFERLGEPLRIASTRRTIARIQLELDWSKRALDNAQSASKIVKDFYPSNQREVAFCAFVEGEIFRWRAYKERAHIDESESVYGSESVYEQAIARYREAIVSEGEEIERRIEYLQGLGCTYRNRAVSREARQMERYLTEQDINLANVQFDAALQIAAKNAFPREGVSPLIASIHEDKAVAYIHLGQFEQARHSLDQARRAIPEEYRIDPDQGIVNTTTTLEQRQYWLQLAQIELQHAAIHFQHVREYANACKRLLHAFACLQAFSPQASQWETFRMLARNWLSDIRDVQLLRNLKDTTHDAYLHYTQMYGEAYEEVDNLIDDAIEDCTLMYSDLS
jgi:tetratricopeptide (TPR) repeat protein